MTSINSSFKVEEAKDTSFSESLILTSSIDHYFQNLGLNIKEGEYIGDYIQDIKKILREFESRD